MSASANRRVVCFMGPLVSVSKKQDGKPLFLKMQVISNLKSKTIGVLAEKNIGAGATILSDAYHSDHKPSAKNSCINTKCFAQLG